MPLPSNLRELSITECGKGHSAQWAMLFQLSNKRSSDISSSLTRHACFLFKFSEHMGSDNSPVMRHVNSPCSMSPVRCWGPECFHTQVKGCLQWLMKGDKTTPSQTAHLRWPGWVLNCSLPNTFLFVSHIWSDCPSFPSSHFILCPLFRVSDILVSMWGPCKTLPFPPTFFWGLKYIGH